MIKSHDTENASLTDALLDDEPPSTSESVPATGCYAALTKPFADDDVLLLALLVYFNVCRDFVWAYFASSHLTSGVRPNENTSSAESEQMLGQSVWATSAMAIGLSLILLIRCLTPQNDATTANKPFPYSDVAIIIIANALSIYPWNLAQKLGYEQGKAQHLSDFDAELHSSVFAGIAEGLVQALVYIIGNQIKNYYTPEPAAVDGKDIALDVSLGIIPGVIPGTAWQLTFALSTHAKLSPAITSLLVAIFASISDSLTVTFTNDYLKPYLVNKLYPAANTDIAYQHLGEKPAPDRESSRYSSESDLSTLEMNPHASEDFKTPTPTHEGGLSATGTGLTPQFTERAPMQQAAIGSPKIS